MVNVMSEVASNQSADYMRVIISPANGQFQGNSEDLVIT